MSPQRSLLFMTFMAAAVACGSDDPIDPPSECTVSAVNITGAPAQISVGATADLGANVTSSDCDPVPTVAWSSDDVGVATVSNSGLVTAVSPGDVTITASAGGKSGTVSIEVPEPVVATVRVAPDSIVVGMGAGPQLAAEALDVDENVIPGKAFSWNTLDAGVATVSGNGTITGVTAGSTSLIAGVDEVEGAAVVHVVNPRVAYFWNHAATPANQIVPDTDYSYTTSAAEMGVSSSSVGVYTAHFPGLGGTTAVTEALFVSPYGGVWGNYCRLINWSGSSLQLGCNNADGEPTNSRWTFALISSATLSGRSAYAWINLSNAAADPEYRFNPTGGEIESELIGVGNYLITFSGLGRKAAGDREGVMTTAYGTAANCQPVEWNSEEGDLVVEVKCFDNAGNPVNSQFTVLVADGSRADGALGFALADQPAAATYTPTNSAVRPTGNVMVERLEEGRWVVRFTGINRSAGPAETFLVSAVGENPGRCGIENWAESPDDATPTNVWIRCSNPSDAPADIPFTIVGLQ